GGGGGGGGGGGVVGGGGGGVAAGGGVAVGGRGDDVGGSTRVEPVGGGDGEGLDGAVGVDELARTGRGAVRRGDEEAEGGAGTGEVEALAGGDDVVGVTGRPGEGVAGVADRTARRDADRRECRRREG